MVTYHEHGGYRMDSSEIGVVLMVVGLCQPLWQVRKWWRVAACAGHMSTLVVQPCSSKGILNTRYWWM